MKTGSALAVVEDTCLVAYDIYLTLDKAAPDKSWWRPLSRPIWDNIEKLAACSPRLQRVDARARGCSRRDHPVSSRGGAFYKEQKLWSPKMDEVQKKLLALNP